MPQKFVGDLSKHDPLHHFLSHDVLPQIRQDIHHPEFSVFRFHSINNKVFLYEEKHTKTKVVGKFFNDGLHQSTKSSERAQREFQNLVTLRNSGFENHPHHVIKPLAYNAHINDLLVEEYAHGDSLARILQYALQDGKYDLLFHKLRSLAYFLASMHNRTANGTQVDFNSDCLYFYHLIGQLKKLRGLSSHDVNLFSNLCEEWRNKSHMWEDQQVLVHGDATPPNFIFGEGNNVTAIDLERMKYADRVFDLGRIVGELQHYFLNVKKNKSAAEPFIGHFLWEYSRHFPNHAEAFRSITARIPFQIAITLLRIARNPWISHEYCHQLLREAKKTLGYS